MLRSFAVGLALITSLSLSSVADTASKSAEVGSAVYRLGPFKLYKATLFSPSGAYEPGQPFELALEYYRNVSAKRIANASIEEIERIGGETQGDLEPLREELEACFGDVSDGDVLKGVWETSDVTSFYRNKVYRCRIDYPGFSENFFSIWLSQKSRFPDKAAQLTNQTAPSGALE